MKKIKSKTTPLLFFWNEIEMKKMNSIPSHQTAFRPTKSPSSVPPASHQNALEYSYFPVFIYLFAIGGTEGTEEIEGSGSTGLIHTLATI